MKHADGHVGRNWYEDWKCGECQTCGWWERESWKGIWKRRAVMKASKINILKCWENSATQRTNLECYKIGKDGDKNYISAIRLY